LRQKETKRKRETGEKERKRKRDRLFNCLIVRSRVIICDDSKSDVHRLAALGPVLKNAASGQRGQKPGF